MKFSHVFPTGCNEYFESIWKKAMSSCFPASLVLRLKPIVTGRHQVLDQFFFFFPIESYSTHRKPLQSSPSIALSCIMIIHRLGPSSCVHFRQGAGSCSAFKLCIAIHCFRVAFEAEWQCDLETRLPLQ